MMAGIRRRLAAVVAAFAFAGGQQAAAEVDDQWRAQQAQLEQLRVYVDQAAAQLALLNAQLQEAQARGRQQNQLINQLENALAERRSADPGWQRRWRLAFFAALERQLPASPIYRVEVDKLVIATDPVFVFLRGEIGAEGRDRLAPLQPALQQAFDVLPAGSGWYLQIEGHTDLRPLRNNPRFASNWHLSAARALALLDLWRVQGVPPERMGALAVGSTRPAVAGDHKAANRQNRRIVVRLAFQPGSD